jgi:integrase
MGRKAVGSSRQIKSGGVIKYQPRVRGVPLGTGTLYDTFEASEKARIAFLEFEAAAAAKNPPQKGVRKVVVLRNGAEKYYFKPRRDANSRSDLQNEESIFRTNFGALPGDKTEGGEYAYEDVCDFIDKPAHSVRFSHIQEWVNKISVREALSAITVGRIAGQNKRVVLRATGKRVTVKTVKNAIGLLHRIFQKLVANSDETRVIANPVLREQLEIPTDVGQVVEHETWTYLTLKEIDRVLAELPYDTTLTPTKDRKKKLRLLRKRANQAKKRAFFLTAIYAGLRKGELCGLRWRHVIFGQLPVHGVFETETPQILVRFSYNGPPKTEHARRETRMLPPVRQAMLDWKEESDALKRAAGRIPSLDDLVFPSDHGGCYSKSWDYSWADRSYKKNGKMIVVPGFRSRIGIRPEVTFHCLRHTCASMLMMGGFGMPKLALEDVKGWLGHSDISVTQRYAHFVPSMLDGQIAQIYTFPVPATAAGDDD